MSPIFRRLFTAPLRAKPTHTPAPARLAVLPLEDRTVPSAPAAPPGFTKTTAAFTNSTAVAIPTTITAVTSTITVSGAGTYLHDLDLSTFITHTYNSDLDITLKSPAGTVVTITTDNAGTTGNVYNGTLWDDSADPGNEAPFGTDTFAASNLVGDTTYTTGTVKTKLAPEEPLSAFRGENPNGTWTLVVSDDASGDGGSLDSWSMDVTTLDAAPTELAAATFTNATPQAIPTTVGAITSTIAVSGAPTFLQRMTLQTFITHTNNVDLDITLKSPAGTVVTITTDNGGAFDDVFNGTVWDDDADPGNEAPFAANTFAASNLVRDTVFTNLVAKPTLTPEEALAAFVGENPNGTWTLTVSDDLAANGGNLASWKMNLFGVAPAGVPSASGSSPAVTAPGGTTQTVTVVYADATGSNKGINASTLGTGDVTVAGPGGFTATPTFVGVSPGGNGTPRTATYTFTPPGGTWDAADNGKYTISVAASEVADIDGNFVPAGAVGTFSVALPATFTVLNAADSGAGSLRQALIDANANGNSPAVDAVVFDPAFFSVARTISLTSGQLPVADSVTVTGPGAGLLTVAGSATASATNRIFNLTTGAAATVTLSGMKLTGANVTANGGAIYQDNGTLNLTDMVLTGNLVTAATYYGGAVYQNLGTTNLLRTTISNNTALLGGGVFMSPTAASNGTLTVTGSTFAGNTSNSSGAGINIFYAGNLTVTGSTFSGNTATGNSGGIYLYPAAGSYTISNSTFANNSATNGGAIGIFNQVADVTIVNTTITANTATAGTGGGGIYRGSGTGNLFVSNTVVSGNTAPAAADILAGSGTVAVNYSAVGVTTGYTGTGGNNLAAGTNLLLGTLASNGGPTQTILPADASPLVGGGSNALVPAGLTTDQRGAGVPRLFGTSVDIGSIEVQPIPPILTTSSGSVTYTENTPAVVVDAGLTISDLDSTQLSGATVQITAGLDAANDVLAFGGGGGIGGTYNPAAGTLSLTGTATLAAYQAALRSVTFISNGDNPAPGDRTIAFRATDTSNYQSVAATRTVTVIAINDPPLLANVTTSPQAVNDNATVRPFQAVTVTDPDSSLTVTVTYTGANGTFTTLGGFTGAAGSYTFSGSAAAAQAALRGLVFNPTNNQVGPPATVTTGFTLTVSDGVAPTVSNNQTTVVATSVNDTPVIANTTSGTQPVSDTGTVDPFTGVVLFDPDAGQTLTVTVSYTAANGTLTNLGGFTGAAGSYTFSGTPAAAQAAVRGLTFVPTPDQVTPGTDVTTIFTIDAADGLATGTNNQTSVTATSINDAPTLGNITAGPQGISDKATVSPFGGVTVTDPDASPVTVTVSFDPANGSFSNLGGFAGSAGSYTFTGTPAAAQAAIRGLVFTPTENQVAPTQTVTTMFAVAVNDGFAPAVTDSSTTVVATSADDTPVIAGTTAGPQPTDDDEPIAPFVGVTITDPDVSPVTVTVSYTAANGSFSNLGGFTGSPGSYSFTGTPAAAQAAVNGLVFVPTQDLVLGGLTVTTVFTLAVDDGYVPPVTDSSTTVVATSVDGTPIIAGTAAGQPVGDNATVSPFAAVTVSDTDSQAFTVTISYPAVNGTFTAASLAASGFGGTAGSYTLSVTGLSPAQATQAVRDAIRQLVFQPTANQVAPGGTVTTTFTIAISDFNSTGTSADTTVVAASVNDAPTLAGITAGPQGITDQAVVNPFAGATVGDVDFASTVTTKVTYTAANGVLTNLGGFTGAAGSYTFTGTPAAAQAALRGLTFVPTNNQATPGTDVTTAFTVSVSDGAAPAVTNGQTTVTTTSVNDAPTLGGATAGAQPVADNAIILPFAGVTVADVDFAPAVTVTLSYDPANGTFSGLGGFTGSAGSYTFSGTPAAAQTALRGLVFNPTANQVAPTATVTTAFTLAVSDGFAPAVTDSQTTVTATSVNDAPTLAGATGGTQSVTDSGTVTPFAGMTVVDPDAAPVTITVGYNATNGSFSNLGGFTGSAGGYVFTGSPAAAQAALRGLVFMPTANQVVPTATVVTTFNVTVDDGLAPAVSSGQTTVSATSVNDAPVLEGTRSDVQGIADDAAVSPFAGVALTDADFASTVTVAINYAAANGVLVNLGGFTGAPGNYTFTGTPAAAEAAVRGLVFVPTANQFAPGTTTVTPFTVRVSDGLSPAVVNSQTTVAATSVNDTPTLSGVTADPQPVADNATISPFADATVSDTDFLPTVKVTVTYDAANGTLTNLGGFVGSAGSYTFSGRPGAAQAALRGLTFVPTNNQSPPGTTVATAFTLTIDDGMSPVVTDSRTTVVTTSVNDLPVVGGVGTGTLTTNDETGVAPFTAITLADADDTTVTVTISYPAADGTFTNLGGFTGSAGSYTLTGPTADVQAAVRGLVFVPTKNQAAEGQSVTTAFSLTVADASGGAVAVRPPSVAAINRVPPAQNATQQFAVNTPESGMVTVFDGSGTAAYSVTAFAGRVLPSGVRPIVADITGDGSPDLIVATGTGVSGEIQIFDGVTHQLIRTLGAFESTFTGGLFLAAGDVDGDGFADLAVSADTSGGSRVVVFSGRTFDRLADFFGIADPNFRGGARVAMGDVNGDGLSDLVVAAGIGGGPRVAVFDGASVRAGQTPTRLVNDFFAFESSLRNGAYVSAGDLNGDGKADLVFGGGPGGGPRVLAFDAATLLADGTTLAPLADFFASDPDQRQGVRVVVKDYDGDSRADLVVLTPTPTGQSVNLYRGGDGSAGETLLSYREFGSDDLFSIYVG